MTEKTEPLVVARFKDSKPGQPRFTASGSIQELMESVAARLPVDLIYAMIPHSDGSGYEMRVVGAITLDILPKDQSPAPQSARHQSRVEQPAPSPTSRRENSATASTDDLNESLEDGEVEVETPGAPIVMSELVAGDSEPTVKLVQTRGHRLPAKDLPASKVGFRPLPIKSQRELMAEMGISEQPLTAPDADGAGAQLELPLKPKKAAKKKVA